MDQEEPELSHNTLEHFPEHAQLIAQIIAEWSHLEMCWTMLLTYYTGESHSIVHPMLYSIPSSRSRLEAMHAAFRQIFVGDDAKLAQIATLMADSGKVLTYRDKLAHALYGWTAKPRGQEGRELGIAGMTEKRSGHPLPLHDLRHEYERVQDVTRQVAELLTDVLHAVRQRERLASDAQRQQAREIWNRHNPPSPPDQPPPSQE